MQLFEGRVAELQTHVANAITGFCREEGFEFDIQAFLREGSTDLDTLAREALIIGAYAAPVIEEVPQAA